MKNILKRTISLLLTLLALCCTFVLPVFAEPGDPVWDQKVKEVIKEAQRKKEEREKERIKAGRAQVDKRLLELEEVYKTKGEEEAKKFAKRRILDVKEGNKITVYIGLKPGLYAEQFDKHIIEEYGCDEIAIVSQSTLVADIPIEMISNIAELQDISGIALPGRPVQESSQSEGVSLTGAHSYLSSGISGTGVKVAVIDGGFAGISSAINSGDLPNNIIKIDCKSTGCVSDSFSSDTNKHGTAVAEIVYDMAPNAQLYLIKIYNEITLKNAVSYCINNGIKIINHSRGWYNQNFYDGQCNQISINNTNVDNVVCIANLANSNNILFVKSAGNSAQRHYFATYTDPGGILGWHNISPPIAANVGDTIALDFTWEAWPTTNQDFDIYLMYYNNEGFLEMCASMGEQRQTGSQSPTESLSCYVDATRTYYVYIVKYSAYTDPRFHIFSSHNINPAVAVAARSLTSPADASGAFAVGAMHWNSWLTGSIEDYSSQGPTSDGRIKPDIVAPDCVSTYS